MAADKVTKVVFVNMMILFIINMLNYADRTTILGEHWLEFRISS